MHQEAREELMVRFKLVVLEHADHFGATNACKEFNVSRATFYRWKEKYAKAGQAGLYRARPVAYRHPRRISPDVVGKILEIRAEYQLGNYVLPGALLRDQDLRIHGSSSIESPWNKTPAQDRSPACSAQQTICKNGSWTPRAGRCEVLAAKRSGWADSETIPIHSHR